MLKMFITLKFYGLSILTELKNFRFDEYEHKIITN